MRVHYVALAAAVLVSSASATSTSTESSPVVARDPTGQEAFSNKRFLRTHTTTDAQEGEERGMFGVNLGFVDDIASGVMKKFDDISNELHVTNLLNGLKKEGKRPDQAFKSLEVGKVKGNLIESNEFQLLQRYVKMTNEKDPEQVLAGAITANIGGDGFSQKMAEAMKNPNTKELATTLEAAQLSRWLKNDFTPGAILKTQKLDKVTDAMFDSPQYATWLKYLEAYNKKNPKKAMTHVELFSEQYGQKGFLQFLGSLDDGPGATKFKDEVVDSWLAIPDRPEIMFKRLKLNEAGDDLLTSPILDMWVKYLKGFEKQYPLAPETTMIQTFTNAYGEEKVATMIQAALKNPETEQFALNLQTAQFKQWMLEKKMLTNAYSEEKVATMIQAVLKNPETEQFGLNLQAAQFKQWMLEKKTPDDVYKQVLKLKSTDSPNADIWRAYYKAYEKKNPGELFSFS